MGRVDKILKARGKKLIGWDEILDGGISPDATVMNWRGIKGGIQAAEMGHSVVMTPSTHVYLDYIQGEPTVEPPVYASLRVKKSYSFEPVPDGVEARYILGGQGNLWTEQIPTLRHAEYMTYPAGVGACRGVLVAEGKKELGFVCATNGRPLRALRCGRRQLLTCCLRCHRQDGFQGRPLDAGNGNGAV